MSGEKGGAAEPGRARRAIAEAAADVADLAIGAYYALRAWRVSKKTPLTFFQARCFLRLGMTEAEIYRAVIRGELP